MSNPLSKVTAALLAVVLLFLVPAVQSAQREEDIRYLSAYHLMVQFADAVRNKGYVSDTMYEDFTRELETKGSLYDIEFEHRHKKYHPEYGDPADSGTFQGRFSVIYDAYYTQDVMNVLFPDSPTTADEDERKYLLHEGDFFTVTVLDRSRSPLKMLSGWLYGDVARAGGSLFTYGGMVLNEDY
ncbi:hypothetical protein ACFQ3W_05100 [Paenibacillus puldeungensis]|uniref:DUF3993 domain-containing protein n=1 Tax=Paenibacillus puldeungensis TaxID=696536 RepID=A0ABW3RU59_9BACL